MGGNTVGVDTLGVAETLVTPKETESPQGRST